jgi:hypothetical protein
MENTEECCEMIWKNGRKQGKDMKNTKKIVKR